MTIHYIEEPFTSEICSFCGLVCQLEFTTCKICFSTCHEKCLKHVNHNCVTCKFCNQNKCFTKLKRKISSLYEDTDEKKHNIDNIQCADDLFDLQTIISNPIDIYHLIKVQTSIMDHKIADLQEKLGFQDIYKCVHGNKNRIDEFVTFYTDKLTFTYFLQNVYYVNRCIICENGFHTREKENNVCGECNVCYNFTNHASLKKENKKCDMEMKPYKVYIAESDKIITKKFLYCLTCYETFVEKDYLCPVCMKEYTNEDMIECEYCYKWIHYSCDPTRSDRTRKGNFYLCPICTIFEDYWVSELTDKARIYTYPLCYYCKTDFSYKREQILEFVKINNDPEIFAHNVCAMSNIKSEEINDCKTIFTCQMAKDRKCTGCKKHGASYGCVLCKKSSYHYNCAFDNVKAIFRSNIIVPICYSHFYIIRDEARMNLFTIKYSNAIFQLENIDKSQRKSISQMNEENKISSFKKIKEIKNNPDQPKRYIKTKNYVLQDNGYFEIYFYLKNEEVKILKCDKLYFYLDGKKTNHSEIERKCKGFEPKVHLENMINELELIYNENYPKENNFIKRELNSCIDVKYQLNNFTLSYISHMISKKQRFYLDKSKIHGMGLFASRIYFPNEVIISYDGEPISISESNRRESIYSAGGCNFYMFGYEKSFVIDATFVGNYAKFINQSCDPNCYSTMARWGSYKGILIVAKKFITVGEEFTYKYGSGFQDKKMKCNCEFCCRK